MFYLTPILACSQYIQKKSHLFHRQSEEGDSLPGQGQADLPEKSLSRLISFFSEGKTAPACQILY